MAGALCTSMRPSWCSTMRRIVLIPRPVPAWGALVVKKGSKRRSWVSLSMPSPSSRALRITSPSSSGPVGSPAETCSMKLPSRMIASRALAARLIAISSSCVRAPRTRAGAGVSSMCRVTRSPSRFFSSPSMDRSTSLRSSTSVLTTSLRLKASSLRVSSAARTAALLVVSAISTSSESPPARALSSSDWARITVMMLLNSCVIPAARRPTTSIFCECCSSSSSRSCLVTSCSTSRFTGRPSRSKRVAVTRATTSSPRRVRSRCSARSRLS